MIVTQSKLSEQAAYEVARIIMVESRVKARNGYHLNRECYWLRNNCCYVNFELAAGNKPINVNYQLQDVCHARLTNDGYAILYFNYRPIGFNILDLAMYIDWMVKESPFAGIFISKNVSDILAYGAVIDTKEHYGLAFAAAIASRTYHEHGREFVTWCHLVKAGVDKTVAYVVAMASKSYALDKETPEYLLPADQLSVHFGHVNHGGVDPYGWAKGAVANFINNKPVTNQVKRYADSTFCDNRKGEWFREFLLGANKAPEPAGGKKFGAKPDADKKLMLPEFVTYVKEVIEPEVLGLKKIEDKVKPVAKKAEGNGQEPVEDM